MLLSISLFTTQVHYKTTTMRHIRHIITLLLYTITINYTSAQITASDNKVVLGWILDGNNKTTLANAQVILTNMGMNKTDTLVTTEGGTYSFNIRANNNYAIFAQKGNLKSNVSYFNTTNTETPIVHINLWTKENDATNLDLLTVSSSDTPRTTSTVLSNPITFSIQLGSFTVKPSIHSQYLEKVKDEVIFEPLDNEEGYMAIIGKFTDYTKAENYYLKIIDLGYIDAKIVAFWGEKYLNISATSARKFVENH